LKLKPLNVWPSTSSSIRRVWGITCDYAKPGFERDA
jgi:hypothetical protein